MPSVAEAAESEDAPSSHIATLPRAFTIEPDTPRRVEWMCGPLIGKGSFAKVYYGIKVDTGDIMAVKQVEMINIPRKKAGGKKDARRRMVDALHQEITLLKDLDHENVVRYLGYDVQGKHINVFLEYVSGGSIASAIATMGRFEEPLVRSLTCQILCGLQYLHERAIIHRDIKGGNVLLDESGVAKITDFGISKKNEYKLAYRMNTKMSLQGSVHWMAPEVVKAKGYSAKVDIWSLGCLVLEMFTGYNPWRQLDELQTVWKLGRENAPPIPEWLSPMAQEFLAKCFTIDPDQRPTAAQLLDHSF
ncbi:kinase-like domain-containing protein, partial [Fimicolochytrium jonesii]|uniref:kinase-like domain-containing protein n=1 Tax=Fimicolochytrium jonesii TaxID=1396493 RepID=UPI0022FEEA3C